MARKTLRAPSFKPRKTDWKLVRGTMVRDARQRTPRMPAREGELKFSDTVYTQDATSTSTLVLLNGMVRGTDASANRIGRNIKLKSIQWRIATGSETSIGQCAVLRYLLVWDKDPNGTLPAVTDILVTQDLESLTNLANKDRFVVIHSDFKLLPENGAPALVSTANQIRTLFEGYKNLNHRTTFNAGNLIPLYVTETLPGDTFSISAEFFGRLQTLDFPTLDNLYFDTFWFYCPNRILWDNWPKFLGAQDSPGASIDYVVPYLSGTDPTYFQFSVHSMGELQVR